MVTRGMAVERRSSSVSSANRNRVARNFIARPGDRFVRLEVVADQMVKEGELSATGNDTLLEKIMGFELDEPGSQLPFTARLAREQGWTHVFAGRVVTEYKRFVALAMLAGHPVTPSVEVDQAWHLHLVYTRSYWHGLCRDVLGRDLHHGPTAGGTEENAKFGKWYQQTVDSYLRFFGHAPPTDIWPSPKKRFANASALRWVDSSAFWLVPKPYFMRNPSKK
jgi:hypothetical protein